MVKSRYPRRYAAARQWVGMLWLTVVWVLLWGGLTWANVIAGAVLAFIVTVGMPMPAINYHGRVRPVRVIHLFAKFAWDLTVASIQVAMYTFFHPRRRRSAVISVQLRSLNDLYMTLTADFCSLVPGTVVVELHRLTGKLYLHILDIDMAGGVEQARADALGQEKRVLLALASAAELARAGLTPRGAAVERSPA